MVTNKFHHIFNALVIIIVLPLLLTGCNSKQKVEEQETFSSLQFIDLDGPPIEDIKVEGCNEDGVGYTVAEMYDEERIEEIVSLLSDFHLEKLSPQEENEILDYGEKIRGNETYIIRLTHSEGSAGVIIVLSEEGRIMFADLSTMGKGRTVMYINVGDKDKVDEIVTLILAK